METTTYIRQSESHPHYHLIRRDNGLHVAMKAPDIEADDGDGYFSCGRISHEENFEPACDNQEEEFRCLLADAKEEFGY